MPSFKAQKANAPKMMTSDGDAAFETDRIVLGVSPGLGTPVAADTLDFLIPAGAQLCQLEFFFDDCDSGAAFLFGVGFRAATTGSTLATNNTYFAAAGQTIGQTGGRLECAFKPIKFEEDVFVQLLVGTPPAGITGNPEIHIVAGYNMQGVR